MARSVFDETCTVEKLTMLSLSAFERHRFRQKQIDVEKVMTKSRQRTSKKNNFEGKLTLARMDQKVPADRPAGTPPRVEPAGCRPPVGKKIIQAST